MRITVRLDPDVARAAERLSEERQLSLSDAINVLARAGLNRRTLHRGFRQRTADLGVITETTNIAETLELLDQQNVAHSSASDTLRQKSGDERA